MKKAVEIVKAGCNVILDWGFWTKAERQETTKYFNQFGIDVELIYVGIVQLRWKQLIEERNKKIKNGNGGSDFYVDEGLMEKLLSKFEEQQETKLTYGLRRNFNVLVYLEH